MKKIIAIDVGNSETTVGVGNSNEWTGYRFTTRKTITSDELLMMFKTIIDIKPIKENLCLFPFLINAERIAIIKSSLLVAINF